MKAGIGRFSPLNLLCSTSKNSYRNKSQHDPCTSLTQHTNPCTTPLHNTPDEFFKLEHGNCLRRFRWNETLFPMTPLTEMSTTQQIKVSVCSSTTVREISGQLILVFVKSSCVIFHASFNILFVWLLPHFLPTGVGQTTRMIILVGSELLG